jgi:endonuclease/exonuclease/phosphatase (EEP) superfamily protein YafD
MFKDHFALRIWAYRNHLSSSLSIFFVPMRVLRPSGMRAEADKALQPVRLAYSLGLLATSQQYFSLRTNQPSATSQQYSSLRTNQPLANRTGCRLKFHPLTLG